MFNTFDHIIYLQTRVYEGNPIFLLYCMCKDETLCSTVYTVEYLSPPDPWIVFLQVSGEGGNVVRLVGGGSAGGIFWTEATDYSSI